MYNHQLDSFIRVCEAGSFGKAAESLYISTPALIQQMNSLEAHCGFRLFYRTSRGVVLTDAGKSMYEDAKIIVRLSHDALEKARHIDQYSESTIRIGTSLLFKCRLLPGLLSSINQLDPTLKIEITSIPEHSIDQLGVNYDLREGVQSSISNKNKTQFLELIQTPICCAVSPHHPLARKPSLQLSDLNHQTIVMPIQNVSNELDALRKDLIAAADDIHIIDSSYYGIDVFTECEIHDYILITQQIYEDILPNFNLIPITPSYLMPYGLIYAKQPTNAAKRFIACVKEAQNLL